MPQYAFFIDKKEVAVITAVDRRRAIKLATSLAKGESFDIMRVVTSNYCPGCGSCDTTRLCECWGFS